MKVEPSGVIFSGVCQIQTEKCVAKEPKPITAVWVPPGRTQIDICGACLDENIRLGEWKIEGARVAGMKIRPEDVAVYAPDAKLQLVVKIKKRLGTSVEWVTRMYQDMQAYALLPNSPYFLFAFSDFFYIWKNASPVSELVTPDYTIETKEVLKRYLDLSYVSPKEDVNEYTLELLVTSWLEDLVKSNVSLEIPPFRWFKDSGLYNAIKNGYVVTKAVV
jgi:hypothetical protein